MRLVIDYPNNEFRKNTKTEDLFSNTKKNRQAYFYELSRITFGLKKYFVFEDFHHFDLLSYFMYEHNFYFQKAPGLMLIFNYLDILDDIKTKKVDIEIDDFFIGTFKNCTKKAAVKKGFTINSLKETYTQRTFSIVYDNENIVRWLLKTRVFVRYMIGMIRKFLFRTKKRKDVVMLSNIRFSRRDERQNHTFGTIKQGLDKECISNKVIRYETLNQTTNLKRFMKEFMFQKESYIGDYYSLIHFLKCGKDMRRLKKKWQYIRERKEVKDLFMYKGYDIYDLIRPRLDLIFNALSYIACDNKNIARAIIDQERLKVLITDHEENMYAKGLMIEGKKKNLKTIALSHEIIAPGAIHTHVKNSIVKDSTSPLWRPLPDIKTVWGRYSKEFLKAKCNYPPAIIKITGNAKFDFIFNSKWDAKKIIKELNLDEKKNKILIASQLNRTHYDEYEKFARNNPNMEVLLKPHPTEDEEYIRKYFKKKPKNLIIISRDFDIYKLIYISNYILTQTSTVGFEAILMGKIVFIFNPKKDTLLGLPYTQSGASIEIVDINDVSKQLKRLENPKKRKRLQKKMKAFIYSQHPFNDGKSAKRIILEIKKLLKS